MIATIARRLLAPDAAPAAAPPTPPPAPATPSPAPAPAPAPSPGTPTPPAPAAGGSDPVRDFDAKLNAAFDTATGTTPPKAGDAPAAPKEPAAAPVTPPKTVATVKQPKELRAELERVSGELSAKGKQITDLEAKIKDYEARGKDTATLSERLTTLEKQLEGKDAELRALKHEASPEYKAKYEAPFNRAAALAERDVTQLAVMVNTDTGETRQATFDDFKELYSLPYAKAFPKAKEMFGDAASLVLSHVTKLHDLEYRSGERP